MPNSRDFHTNFNIKISNCIKTDARFFLTSLVTQNSMYFPGYFQIKAMKSMVNLASNQCLC